MDRIVAVLAGDRCRLDWLAPWLLEASVILAADGAADAVARCGLRPDYIVGDMDSVSSEGLARAKEVVEIHDQDHSDCEKLLSFASSKNILEMVLCGVEGTRIDHMLHGIQCVAQWKGRCLIAYEKMLARVLVGPASMKILTSGIISAIPLGACSDVTLSGVEWPVAGSAMAPLGFRSVSNVGTGEIEVSVGDGALMICWEYAGMPIWDPFLP